MRRAPAASQDSARIEVWLWRLAPPLIILLAFGLRVALLARSNWLLEGDDSLSTLMALGIMDGDRPIMLKNQTYAGAWEPYAMAASFALLGVSRTSAKLPELLTSTALVGATWLLAREIAGRAAGVFAALLMAIPPAYVLVLSLKPWAPYTEVMLLGSLTVMFGLRLAFPRPAQHDACWAASCGLAAGLGFWMHPIAAFYIAPAALLIALRLRGRKLARVMVVGLVGFGIGSLPFWAYNLETNWATVRFVAAGMGGQTAARTAVMAAWWNADLPRGAGLWQPWGPSPRILAGLLAGLEAIAFGWAVLWARRWSLRRLDSILLLLLGIPILFTLSGFGGPALNPWGFDATGRYAPPIWTGIAVLLGVFLASVMRSARLAAHGMCAVVLAITGSSVIAMDPHRAFQSPYWPKLVADNGPLLATLRTRDVRALWMNHWAGFPLMFDARAQGFSVFAYDWYDVEAGGIDRFPELRSRVQGAQQPAFVLVTDEPKPELEDRLDGLRVAYETLRVGPYVVVIPTSRKVDPSEVASALDYRY